MQNLFPIIRRKRRPLVVADALPVVVGKSVPDGPPSPVATESAPPVIATPEPENDDAQVTPQRKSR